jgi:hypothetical protein
MRAATYTVRPKKSPSWDHRACVDPDPDRHLRGVLRLLEEVQPTGDRVARIGEVEHDAVAELEAQLLTLGDHVRGIQVDTSGSGSQGPT